MSSYNLLKNVFGAYINSSSSGPKELFWWKSVRKALVILKIRKKLDSKLEFSVINVISENLTPFVFGGIKMWF